MKAKNKTKNDIKKSSKHAEELSKFKLQFLNYYSKLPIQKLAAEFIGKDENTIIRWKKKDKKFADHLASTKSTWALEKVGKVKSNEWLLERILKEHFVEKKEVDSTTSIRLEATLDRMSKLIP